MKCQYCDQDAVWVDNAEIYGKRYGNSYMMWLCKPCDAYVGCHQNTKEALGTLANKELRDWRQKAHRLFDPLWKDGSMSRQEAYHWLKTKTGRWVHMGESDIETCKLVVKIVESN